MDPALQEIRRDRAIQSLVPLFLASGATSLIYEILWERQLHLLFGTSQIAVSTVLAGFMTGLALGGWLGARIADRTTRPLFIYGLLELGIGLYALLFPTLLATITPVYLEFYRAFTPGPWGFGVSQFALVAPLLLIPTTAMGMTLPLLARFATRSSQEAGTQIGRLYGANTLGAVIGVTAAGFVLLPSLGLLKTTLLAATFNIVLFVAAVSLSRTVAPMTSPKTANSSTYRGHALFYLLAAMMGLTSLIYEVAWFRLLTLILGASAYAFSMMLLAFLIGIGAGGWKAGKFADRLFEQGGKRRVLMGFFCVQLAIAVFAWGAMYTYSELPWFFTKLYHVTWSFPQGFFIGQVLIAMAVMVPATFCMGVSFVLLVRAVTEDEDHIGRPVGLIYASNTAGAVLGATLTGLWFLPALHISGTVVLAIALNMTTAAVAVVLVARHSTWNFAKSLSVIVLGLSCAIGLLLLVKPPWNPLLMSSGTYKYASDIGNPSRKGVLDFCVTPYELLYYAEGVSSIVTVAKSKKTGALWLANNGKIDASTGRDMPTQLLVSHLPFFYHQDPKDVLVIGFAAGFSAGAVTQHPGPTKLDFVEIEPRVITSSHYFDAFNNRPLDDPRANLLLNDGRNHVMLTAEDSYDIIISEPSNPWLTGVSNLFTAEFYELGKSRLKPGGVWSQWIQIYGMQEDDMRTMLSTFADAFPYVHLYLTIADADMVLVGSEAPLKMSADVFERRIEGNPALKTDLKRIEIASGTDLLTRYWMNGEQIRSFTAGAIRNTDDNMRIEYSAPKNLHVYTGLRNHNVLRKALGDVPPVPSFAVNGAQGRRELAAAYASQEQWIQALMALKAANELEPEHAETQALYDAYQQELLKALQEQDEVTEKGGAH